MKNFKSSIVRLCVGGLLVMLMASARAGLVYSVSIDTQSLAGSSGYLDFGLVGLADSPGATVGIASLSGGSAQGAAQLDGDASATAGGWTLGNGGAFNGVLQAWQFGGTLSFLLDFGGDWLNAGGGSGTTFAFKLWDDSFNALLSNDGFGDLLRIELSSGGASAVELFDRDGNGTPSPVSVVAVPNRVPEPASWTLMLMALAVLGAQATKRGRR